MADCGKDRAPIQGLSIRWGFSRYEAQKMSGTIQSSNYVPGVSGWKFGHVSGDFEINNAQIQVGTLPSDPQLITVTAGSWSEYDLPANALERLAFIGAELEKIPAECRASAEFTTEDISFDRDGSDVRASLTYERHETAEEVAARLSKPKGSTFKIDRGGLTFSRDGVAYIQLTDSPDLRAPEQPEPFKVDGGQVSIDKAFVEGGSITKAKVGDEWPVRMDFSADGKKYAAGIGLGIESEFLASADKFRRGCMCGGGYTGDAPKPGDALKASGVSAMLDQLASKIGESKLCQDLKEQVDLLGSNLAEQVKTVIRKELMPGGLLNRSR
ncbi:hypothetical protein C1Y27_23680 [Pseudomonas sp. GW704-F2]|nr:hypothetical protein C1Y27_23680 [Pseudomonas sp. GW704-F2]